MSKQLKILERISFTATRWIGTPYSLILHTLLFTGAFLAIKFGASLDDVLLILTTAVSLEAIYLAILIQITVNRNTESLEEVEENLEDIQEDVKGLEEDIEDIQEEDQKDDKREIKTQEFLKDIEEDLNKLLEDIEHLKIRKKT